MHQSGCPAEAPTCDRYAEEFAAWSGFLQAHAAVARGLDDDLRAAHGLPLSEFEVLLWLARGPCQQMRMSALAESALLSPSGISRAVERLEARRLVKRERCPEDRRGTLAILTGEGLALIGIAGATLAAGIRRRLLDRLSAEEQQTMAAVWERLARAEDGEARTACPAWEKKGA